MDGRLGSIYGALVGDAYGGIVEFIKVRPLPKDCMAEAEKMNGGGFLNLAPGQITDDGELTICLLQALVRKEDPMVWYREWYRSNPIDIGNTCLQAFTGQGVVETSQANGALMRASAIGIMPLPLAEIAKLAREDAKRSHPHPVCQEANVAYCVAIASIVGGLGRAVAEENALKFSKHPDVHEWIRTLQEETGFGQIGWLRWGLSYAFHFLRTGANYETAIRETVRKGGDTDTNACIVGGLLGAEGVAGIPPKWLKKVLGCKARPVWLRPAVVEKLLKK